MPRWVGVGSLSRWRADTDDVAWPRMLPVTKFRRREEWAWLGARGSSLAAWSSSFNRARLPLGLDTFAVSAALSIRIRLPSAKAARRCADDAANPTDRQ